MRKLIRSTWIAFVLAAPVTLGIMVSKKYPFTLAEVANCYAKCLAVYLGACLLGVLVAMYLNRRFAHSDPESDSGHESKSEQEGAGA